MKAKGNNYPKGTLKSRITLRVLLEYRTTAIGSQINGEYVRIQAFMYDLLANVPFANGLECVRLRI